MSCYEIVVECDERPGLGRVAAIAIRTKMSVVRIILDVTAQAVALQCIGEWIVTVAIATAKRGVLPVNRELCVTLVIETGIQPVGRIMAVAAIFTASAFVRIIRRMTAKTGGRCILEGLIVMAIQAPDLLMTAQQRKIGDIMIELGVLPFKWRMAVTTVIA